MFEAIILASGLTATVDSVRRDKSQIVTAIVRVVSTATVAFDTVYIHCGFLDGVGVAIKESAAMVSNLQPGETAFSSVRTVDEQSAIRSAKCRIGMTQP